MFKVSPKKTDFILINLIALDIILSVVGLFFPDLWCKIFHDMSYVDPYAFLRRTASLWVAFTLFQTIALIKWRHNYFWLLIIAGLRL